MARTEHNVGTATPKQPHRNSPTETALPNHLLQPPFQTVPSTEGLNKTQPAILAPVFPWAALPAFGTPELSGLLS